MGAHSESVWPPTVARPQPQGNGLWIGPQQKAALAHLAAATPLKVLVGPHSSGKSTLLGHLPHAVPDAMVLPIAGPQESAASVLVTLLAAAGLGPCQHSEIGQRNLLIAFFDRLSWQSQQRIILAIDEVAGFSPAAWKEIDRLRLLKVGQAQLIELVIAASEEETPKTPLRSLLHDGSANAIEVEYCLSAPTDKEVAGYIAWKLSRQRIATRFSGEACCLINRLALGRFAAINIFCQHLLLSQPDAAVVTADMVKRSATLLAALRRKTASSPRQEPKSVRENRIERLADGSSDRVAVSFKDTLIREIELTGRLMIGSAEDCDLHLLSRFVNRHHALIVPLRDGKYCVADLNSEQGLTVNGRRTVHHVLADGDVISVGPFRLRVQLNQANASRRGPARLAAGAQAALQSV